MTVIAAIVLLGVLIFVHELGHFAVAKLLGVKVERFSLGFGPKVVGITRGETEYRLSAIPLGGYVKMLGENPDEEEELREEDKPRAFTHQAVWKRFVIVFAGPLCNILFAVFVFMGVLYAGIPILEPTVGEVMDEMPALAAGIEPGDRVVAIDDAAIATWAEMTEIVHRSPGEELRVKVLRGGDELVFAITPRSEEGKDLFGEPRKIGLIGVRPKGDFFTKRYGLFEAFTGGFQKTYEITHLTLLAFVKLVQRVIPADNLGGPILILSMAGERAAAGMVDYFTFMAVISINLGVINLFPVPVLDGGHILFLAIEAVRGRRLREKTMIIANKVGLALLLALVAFALYNDIVKMFAGSLVPR